MLNEEFGGNGGRSYLRVDRTDIVPNVKRYRYGIEIQLVAQLALASRSQPNRHSSTLDKYAGWVHCSLCSSVAPSNVETGGKQAARINDLGAAGKQRIENYPVGVGSRQ
jgi:hypothetical protein